jgi:hypothetical protein
VFCFFLKNSYTLAGFELGSPIPEADAMPQVHTDREALLVLVLVTVSKVPSIFLWRESIHTYIRMLAVVAVI